MVEWVAGWYATRLHALDASKEEQGRSEMRALCGAYVRRYPATKWARERIERGLPKCKHCEKIISAEATKP